MFCESESVLIPHSQAREPPLKYLQYLILHKEILLLCFIWNINANGYTEETQCTK